jgi:hypothetical protein
LSLQWPFANIATRDLSLARVKISIMGPVAAGKTRAIAATHVGKRNIEIGAQAHP